MDVFLRLCNEFLKVIIYLDVSGVLAVEKILVFLFENSCLKTSFFLFLFWLPIDNYGSGVSAFTVSDPLGGI